MDNAMLGMGIVFAIKDEFSREAQNIQAHFGRLEGGANAMAQKVTASMSAMKMGMAGIGIGIGILAPFASAINSARDFEQQLSNIKSLGVTKEQMADVEKEAMRMGAATKFSALEAGQGIEELLKAGVSLKDVMNKDGLSGALDLAVAGGLDLASASEIASTALNAFKADSMTIRDAGDILSGAANASATDVRTLKFSLASVSAVASGMGLSFKDTNLALATFAQNGLKGSDAGTSLKAMLMNLQPRTKEQIATFQQLGLITASGANAFFDATGNIKSMADISGLLSTQLKHLNPQQRAFALETMFGSDAVRAGNILFKEGAQGINKMQQEMTKFTSASVAKERMNNLNGAIEMLMGSIDTILIQTGKLFLPLLTNVTKAVGVVVDVFSKFIDTPIGKTVAVLTAGFGAFAFVMGTVVVVTNLATFATASASLAFARMGMAQVATAFATQGLLGGLRALLVTMLPLIIQIGLFVAPLVLAYKSFEAFQDVLNGTVAPAKGLLGYMQKFGAVIWGVGQALSSWDGKTFDLAGMEAQLKSVGMLDTVRTLSTYFVRFYEFGKGFITGIGEVFSFVGQVVSTLVNYVTGAMNMFSKAIGLQGASFKDATSSIQSWINAGKVLGYIVGTVLVGGVIALTYSLASMAIAVIAATWPVLAIIAAISAVVAVFYYWNDIVAWFTKGWGNAMKWIGTIAQTAFTYLRDNLVRDISKALFWVAHKVPEWFGIAFRGALSLVTAIVTQFIPWLISQWWNFIQWTTNNIPSLIIGAFSLAFQGIYWYFTTFIPTSISYFSQLLWWVFENVPYFLLSAFASAFIMVLNLGKEFFVSIGKTFYDIGEGIINALWEGMKAIWGSVVSWYNSSMEALGLGGVMTIDNANASNATVPSINPQQLGQQFAELQAQRNGSKVTNNNTTTNTTTQPSIFQIQLDGEVIAEVVDKKNRQDAARR